MHYRPFKGFDSVMTELPEDNAIKNGIMDKGIVICVLDTPVTIAMTSGSN